MFSTQDGYQVLVPVHRFEVDLRKAPYMKPTKQEMIICALNTTVLVGKRQIVTQSYRANCLADGTVCGDCDLSGFVRPIN